MIIQAREEIHQNRVNSERDGLLHDISTWKKALSPGSIIHHHVDQFEQLCQRILIDKLETLYDPDRWPNLDRSTFNSLMVSVLSGKWVLLRQVALQRAPGNPYLNTLQELDEIAAEGYEKLRQALVEKCGIEDLSSSPPLVYLGPMARLFIVDKEAPCLISTPFGAANETDPHGQMLCRQTIPHEVTHAVFDQLPDLMDELKIKLGLGPARRHVTSRLRAIDSVVLNWLDEIVADMAGTALGGENFALSASVIMTMPDKAVGITDQTHPIPLLRPYIHAWTLHKLALDTNSTVASVLQTITSPYLQNPFESIPLIISVPMKDVLERLIHIVGLIWDTPLDTLKGHSLGSVLTEASTRSIPKRQAQELPQWGKLPEEQEELVFRLVGTNNSASPLPRSPLYLDWLCCPMKWQSCCSQTVM